MKRTHLLLLALSLAALAPRAAGAQVFGTLAEARPLPVNGRLAGAYLLFDNDTMTLLGQLRLSFYPNVDFGFQGGLARASQGGVSRTAVDLGGDFKVLVAQPRPGFPLSLSLGGALGVQSADNFNVLAVGPQLVGSWQADAAGRFTPYVGVGLLVSRLDAGGASVSDVSMPLTFGAEFHAMQDLRLMTELRLGVSDDINDDVRFAVGANFPF